MSCNDSMGQSGSDRLDLSAGTRHFDASTTGWLLGEAIRHLNTGDDEGSLAYQRVIEILAERKDAMETAAQLSFRAAPGDVPLRWNLLYLIGAFAGSNAADFLVRTAMEPLPERQRVGCEGPRDLELLVRTMAVESLQYVARRHAEAADHVLKLVGSNLERPVLIEAVKAAKELGLADKVRGILKAEDHWMLDIRTARTEEVVVEAERKEGGEVGFRAPKMAADHTAPSTCHCRKEN
ncbi:MAG: hypothetical protein ABI972_16490 [Acidobacteriota bacterium]